MKRRDFIKTSLVLPTVPLSACMNAASNQTEYLISATYNHNGGHQLLIQQLNNKIETAYAMPFRGHDVLVDEKQIIVFGRRPETRCFVINRETQQTRLMHASNHRHFYGHGVVLDNAMLTTENNFEDGIGVIGIRDRHSLKTIGEYSSYGIGPHDCQLLADGKTLAVANGGMRTHPETGYRTLNKESIAPSLVLIDVQTGNKIDEFRLDDNLLSIRHLSVSDDGGIGAALQYQGNAYQATPESLVAWLSPAGEFSLLKSEPTATKTMHGYMGDIAWHQASNVLAVTSPKGNQVTFWDPQQQSNSWNLTVPQACGIVSNQDGFVVSTQTGALLQLKASHKPVAAQQLFAGNESFAWDNHAQLVS